jgi:plasmid stabilization system protein ParE
MKYQVRCTDEALANFDRLYDYLIEWDVDAAERSCGALQKAIKFLEDFPSSCRKARGQSSFRREMVVSSGFAGRVALFGTEDSRSVTVVAVRHHREEDYH